MNQGSGVTGAAQADRTLFKGAKHFNSLMAISEVPAELKERIIKTLSSFNKSHRM